MARKFKTKVVDKWEGRTVTVEKRAGKGLRVYYFRIFKGKRRRVSREKALTSLAGIKAWFTRLLKVERAKRIEEREIEKRLVKVLWWWNGIPSRHYGYIIISVGAFPLDYTKEEIEDEVMHMHEFAHIGFTDSWISDRPDGTYIYDVLGNRIER